MKCNFYGKIWAIVIFLCSKKDWFFFKKGKLQFATNYIVLKHICVWFSVLPAQYIPTQILSSWPSLLYIHGPMGIFNIRSQNLWVNQNEKIFSQSEIFNIRSQNLWVNQNEKIFSQSEMPAAASNRRRRRASMKNGLKHSTASSVKRFFISFDLKVRISDSLEVGQKSSHLPEIVASKTLCTSVRCGSPPNFSN